eukprot:Sspe_Gene.13901::Locus_4787_Transcript_1_1_Confidence_1.000_Length_1332::g.13901::m.13901
MSSKGVGHLAVLTVTIRDNLQDLPLACIVCAVLWCVHLFTGAVPCALLSLVTGVVAAGLLFLYFFMIHTMRTVFSKQPRITLPALRFYFTTVRPLESMWRLATAPLRCVPDILIVGEVRCGTTTCATNLARFPGASSPFCPWRVPFADHKESFYMVGHYFGLVHPLFYRMVFPTVFAKWWAALRGKPFFTYDACAQYLSAPWAAEQLHRVNPKAKIVVCIREPVSQNVSWWKFEMGSVLFIEGAGLTEPVPGRTTFKTFREAFEASLKNTDVKRAEELGGASRLPTWAQCWPGGNQALMTVNGRYADNAERYIRLFGKDNVEFFDVSEWGKETMASVALPRLNRLMPVAARLPVDAFLEWEPVHSNAGPVLDEQYTPDKETLGKLREYYAEPNERLQKMIGRPLPW